MQELVWQVAHGVDFKAGKTPLNERFPFLELDTCWTAYMSTTWKKRSVSKTAHLMFTV